MKPDRRSDHLPDSGSPNPPFLITALLTVAVALSFALLAARVADSNLPGNYEGFEPAQPVAFSHLLHAGEMRVSCTYCHPGALRSRYAGTPSLDVCFNCHRFVQATLGAVRAEEELAEEENRPVQTVVSDEIRKIYQGLGLNLEGEVVSEPASVRWTRVHDLPDYVVFHHGAHAAAGISCAECHGQAERMVEIRQVETLSMGWCVECHRDYDGRRYRGRPLRPSLDCIACHY